jgi:hypothetical protein
MEQKPTGIFFCKAQSNNLDAALGAVQEGIKAQDFSAATFLQLVIQQVAIPSNIANRIEVQYCVVAVMRFPDKTTADFSEGIIVQ